MCRSRGPPPASSSPLGAYSSPAAHRITPHNLTSPLDLPLSTYFLVEQPPPQYAQRLDWVVDISCHHMRHASLTCAAGDTRWRSYRRIRACSAPTCISRQTWAGSCSAAPPAALCCNTPCSHAPSLLSPSLCSTHSARPVSRQTHTHKQAGKYE